MYKSLYLSFIFAVFLAACQPTETVQKETILNGKITNPTSEEFTLYTPDSTYTSTLEDGTFRIVANLEESNYYRLNHGRESSQAWIIPGDSLYITLDTEQFDESIDYQGDNAINSRFLAKKYLFMEELDKDLKFSEAYAMSEDSFVNFFENRSQSIKDFVANNEAFETLDSELAKLEQKAIDYELANNLSNYEPAHQYYTDNEDFECSTKLKDKISSYFIEDESLLKNENYKKFMQSYVMNNAQASIEEYDYTSALHSKMELEYLDQKVENQKLRDIISNSIMNNALYSGLSDGSDALLTTFKSVNQDKEMIEDVESEYEQWAKLAPGSEAPYFAYPDIEGHINALSDFKGKYIYIDVWATWCGPCLRELTDLEALQEEFKANDRIVFTSISIDDNKEAWRKMVTEKDMKGVQLIADAGWSSKITEDYKISGIPRFIIIDDQGKIADISAYRPSNEKLKPQLDNYLNELKS